MLQALGDERRGAPCVARRRGQCLRFSRGVVDGAEVVTFAAGVATWPKDRGRLAEGKGLPISNAQMDA
jgi:hypothetical protein